MILSLRGSQYRLRNELDAAAAPADFEPASYYDSEGVWTARLPSPSPLGVTESELRGTGSRGTGRLSTVRLGEPRPRSAGLVTLTAGVPVTVTVTVRLTGTAAGPAPGRVKSPGRRAQRPRVLAAAAAGHWPAGGRRGYYDRRDSLAASLQCV